VLDAANSMVRGIVRARLSSKCGSLIIGPTNPAAWRCCSLSGLIHPPMRFVVASCMIDGIVLVHTSAFQWNNFRNCNVC